MKNRSTTIAARRQYTWSDVELLPLIEKARRDPGTNNELLAEIGELLSSDCEMPILLRSFLAEAFQAAAKKPAGLKANRELLESLYLKKPGKGRRPASDWYQIGREVFWEMQPHEHRKRPQSERAAIKAVAKRRKQSEDQVSRRFKYFKKSAQ